MAAAAQLHYASESEAEMAYDAEYQPDHTLLLGGCLCVVMAAYMLVSVLPWPWLQRNSKSNGNQQRHRWATIVIHGTASELQLSNSSMAAKEHTCTVCCVAGDHVADTVTAKCC